MRNLSGAAKSVQNLAFLAEQSVNTGRLEQRRSKMSRYKQRQIIQLRRNTETAKTEEMVER